MQLWFKTHNEGALTIDKHPWVLFQDQSDIGKNKVDYTVKLIRGLAKSTIGCQPHDDKMFFEAACNSRIAILGLKVEPCAVVR